MQALRVEMPSDDLSGVVLRDLPEPERGAGEVLVRVRAASLNFPDLLMTRGGYQFKPEVPFTAGMELAGEVIEADRDSGFAPGDRVMGGAKTGAFAELAACPARSLRRVPEGLDWSAAASLGAAYTTAYTALVELGGLQAGQWVLVHGASSEAARPKIRKGTGPRPGLRAARGRSAASAVDEQAAARGAPGDRPKYA